MNSFFPKIRYAAKAIDCRLNYRLRLRYKLLLLLLICCFRVAQAQAPFPITAVGLPTPNPACAGGPLSVTFVEGNLPANNPVYSMSLYVFKGNTYQRTVDLPSSTKGSPLNVTLPANLSTSSTYQLAVVISIPGSITYISGPRGPFTINAIPTQFTVTGGGAYCSNSPVPTVDLSGSETGVSYQLLRNNTPVGDPVTGTGVPISFGPQSQAGTYIVQATNSPCQPRTMTGSVSVSVNLAPEAKLVNDGPLTCGSKPVVSLTASGGGRYEFSAGASQVGSTTAPNALVSQPGEYSVRVVSDNGCSAVASTTVTGTTTPPAAPTLAASATKTVSQPISVTATGCSGATINWLVQGGTGSANGSIYTFSQPGNYLISARCDGVTCPGVISQSLTLQILPPGFAITSVNMVNCQLTNAASGEYQVRFLPQYSGQNSNPISFSIVNEKLPTLDPGPYALRLYSDNPAITLVANQAGNAEARFRFNWLAACQAGTSPNRPPTTTGVPNQTLVQNQAYKLVLTTYFSDPDQQPLSFTQTGLPAGLQLTGNVISGVPSASGVSNVSLQAIDPGGLQVATSFQLTVNPAPTSPTGFTITSVNQVSCEVVNPGLRRLTFIPQYAGVDQSPISFSVVNEKSPTTNAGPYSLNLYIDNPVITLSARQGSVEARYRYSWLKGCQTSARRSVPEAEIPLQVRILGNPVVGQSAVVEISGVERQPVQIKLLNLQGRMIHQQLIEASSGQERVWVPLPGESGALLLQVSTSSQQRQLKLLKQ